MAIFTFRYSANSPVYGSWLTYQQTDTLLNPGVGVLLGTQAQATAACKVSQNDGLSLSVAVNPGDWVATGVWASFPQGQSNASGCNASGQYVLTVPTNNTGATRQDYVTARIDTGAGVASYQYLTGTTSPPSLTYGGSIFEFVLAQIALPATATAVTNAMITDARFGAATSYISGPAQHMTQHMAGGADPLYDARWPEGSPLAPSINSNGVLIGVRDLGAQTIAAGGSYTVPAGLTLAMLGVYTAASNSISVAQPGAAAVNLFCQASGMWELYQQPLFVQSGGVVSCSAGAAAKFRGVLIPATGKLTGVSLSLPAAASAYTVPAGKFLVVTHLTLNGGSDTLQVGSDVYAVTGMGSAGVNYTNLGYVGFGGAGATTTGALGSVDAAGGVQAAPAPPFVLPSGSSVAHSSTTATLAMHGYLWPNSF